MRVTGEQTPDRSGVDTRPVRWYHFSMAKKNRTKCKIITTRKRGRIRMCPGKGKNKGRMLFAGAVKA